MDFVEIEVVEAGFLGLGVLEMARDAICSVGFYEIGTCLMKAEGHFMFPTLSVQIEHPVIVERACIFSRFATDADLIYLLRIKPSRQVDTLQHRSNYYRSMPYWHRQKYRHSEVGAVLILDGATDHHAFVTGAPVGR